MAFIILTELLLYVLTAATTFATALCALENDVCQMESMDYINIVCGLIMCILIWITVTTFLCMKKLKITTA